MRRRARYDDSQSHYQRRRQPGPQNTSTGYARYHGFLAATKRASLKADRDLIVNGKSFSESEGQRSLEAIIKTRKKFTAVLAANDLLALGCLSIPEDANADLHRGCDTSR